MSFPKHYCTWRTRQRIRQVPLIFVLSVTACQGVQTTPLSSSEAAAPEEQAGTISEPIDDKAQPPSRYKSLDAPLIRRTNTPSAGTLSASGEDFTLFSGDYQLTFNGETLLLNQSGKPAALLLQPLGEQLNPLPYFKEIKVVKEDEREEIVLSGETPWASFVFRLWVYPYNPGLFHYQLELTLQDDLPPGQTGLEWVYVDLQSAQEVSGKYRVYSERAAGAAPAIYGYSEALDSTLLYWVDLTRLNPFIEAARYSSLSTPARLEHRFGHILNKSSLRRLPQDQPWVIYDSYLYLSSSQPGEETEMFQRYLQQVGDIYDLLARPSDRLPDWQALALETLAALQDPDTWVELDGQRYWRAYVGDTRQSAEAISQFDIGLSVARYVDHYGENSITTPILTDSLAAVQNFYNPNYRLIQNSGPISQSGDQGRGDTWYELGHALKAAEWGMLGANQAADLAFNSQAAWMDFAKTVDYQFPQYYNFSTWQGTGREPDAAGGYALYMLRLVDLGCGELCLEEAKAAVAAFPGSGFSFAYETHMTAAAALAAAKLADRTGDAAWLNYAYGPIANLMRLSWIYEVDYGAPAAARTFFGLAPTQRAAAITPKEQYEAWIYLGEFLELAHGQIDPATEKLVAEFYHHTLITLADSFPPLLSPGVATEYPAAYETVSSNRLDLYIPLEDMRDGWDVWGAIGQEVYGAGMAPTFAALAYVEVAPGVTVYGGYPIVEIDGAAITFAGVPGMYVPVMGYGIMQVFGSQGESLAVEDCGQAICFLVEGGQTIKLMDDRK